MAKTSHPARAAKAKAKSKPAKAAAKPAKHKLKPVRPRVVEERPQTVADTPDPIAVAFEADVRVVQGAVVGYLAGAGLLTGSRTLRASVEISPDLINVLTKGEAPADAVLSRALRIQLITLYRDELGEALKDVLGFLASEAPFRLAEHNGAIVYATPGAEDDDQTWLVVREAASQMLGRGVAEKRLTLGPAEKTRELRVAVRHVTGRGEIDLEIALRSAFDDLHAEIAAQLSEHGTRPVAAELSPNLDVFTTYVAQSYASAQKVRDDASPEARRPNVITATLDADQQQEIDYVEKICTRAGIGEEFIARVTAALGQKAKLGPMTSSRLTEASRRPQAEYGAIARELDALQKLIEASSKKTSHAFQQTCFLLRLEEAVCRLLTSERGERQSALAIFSELESKYPDRPTLWFRLAQTNARVASEAPVQSDASSEALTQSSTAYRRAAQTLAEAEIKPLAQRELILSAGQARYLRENIARLHSFALWRWGDRLKQATPTPTWRSLDRMAEAYQIIDAEIRRGGAEAAASAKLLNNAVSYGAHAIEVVIQMDIQIFEDKLPNPDDLRRHIDVLVKSDAAKDPLSLQVWDSIAHARYVTKDKAGARVAAQQFVDFYTDCQNMPEAKPRSAYEAEALNRALNRALQYLRETT